MIYFDNGATSFPKPKEMIRVMEECMLKYCGNPGRSGHEMSMKTGEAVYKSRKYIAKLFNVKEPERIIFTKNTTEALNLGIKGILKEGDHAITSSMEHNSVLRPLKMLEKKGVRHTIISASKEGCLTPADIERAIKSDTKMIIITAASNVTGTKMPLDHIGKIARKKGIIFMVDAAQGAGVMDLDVEKLNIDMLAAPGHKGLLGPLGTGFLYAAPHIKLRPLITGGTGTISKSRLQPREFPEGFEAGTINAPAIIGLGQSVEFVRKIGPRVIGNHEEELISCLEERLNNMEFVTIYGPKPCQKTGISLINIDGMEAEEVTSILSNEYAIAVRGGYHCAGLAHKSIGTWNRGAVRISPGPFNTKKEILYLADALWKIGKGEGI